MSRTGGKHTSRVIEKNAASLHFSLDKLDDKSDNTCVGRDKNPHAVALGSLGGRARAKNLSAEEKASIASQGGKARFAKMTAEERSRYAKRLVAARERKRRERR
jgi:hypothetical protein